MNSAMSIVPRLSLCAILAAVPAALAQDDRTTAGEVTDRETLKAFVLSARDYVSGIADFDGTIDLLTTLWQEGGDWRHGNTFIIILEPNGTIWLHGADPELSGKDLSNVEDEKGERVFPKMLAAAQSMDAGNFVEYSWDDPSDANDTNPKVCYAAQFTFPMGPDPYLIVGGYYQDVSEIKTPLDEFPASPPIAASDVVDRETLKAFVRVAVEWTREAIGESGVDLLTLLEEFRRQGGYWRQGSTYLYVMTEEGYVIFHGARPDQEGHIQIERKDRNGVRFVKQLIDAAASGGGYAEYYWDDPSVVGDEEIGSAKVGYAQAFTAPDDIPIYAGQTVVIGSGFYKGNQTALDFAHFANGTSFSSDVVLVNLAGTPIRPLVYFYDKEGELIDPGSMVDVMGNLEATDFGALTLQSELPSLGEITISTNGRGELVTGSVKVVTEGPDSPIGGVLRFDATGIGVAGAGPAKRSGTPSSRSAVRWAASTREWRSAT